MLEQRDIVTGSPNVRKYERTSRSEPALLAEYGLELADVADAKNYHFVKGDIADMEFIDSLFSKEHFVSVPYPAFCHAP